MLITYFSRSGHCENAAKKLAAALDVQIIPIVCQQNWQGLSGILRLIGYKIFRLHPAVSVDQRLLQAETIILLSPIWDGQLALPVQEALREFETQTIYLLSSSKRSRLKDKKRFAFVGEITDTSSPDEAITELVKRIQGA